MKNDWSSVRSVIAKVAVSKYRDVFQALDNVLFLGFRANILTERQYLNIILSLCKHLNDLSEGADSVAPGVEHR